MTELHPGGAEKPPSHDDSAALHAACQPGTGLCTIVGLDGSYSRRPGAQLAVASDGTMTGSLADGCLERQLASELSAAAQEGGPVIRRFGAGSANIDFRLPCGSGIDVLIDPAPDRAACRQAVADLCHRRAAQLPLPASGGALATRHYIPPPRLLAFGEGPELTALLNLARASGVAAQEVAGGVAPGDMAARPAVDRWTAIVLLYHEHEWEQPLLQWALGTDAFLIGAQGGARTRVQRLEQLAEDGQPPEGLARIVSPIGLIPRSREPRVLALSILAQVVERYEQLHPHG